MAPTRQLPVRTRAGILVSLTAFLSLLLGGAANAYMNFDHVCGEWPNGSPISIGWKWDGDINISGWWAYAFATVAEPNWDNSFTKVQLSYSSGASGEYGVYYADDGWAGQAYVWCDLFCPCYIYDFLAEGNLEWHGDSSWDAYMGNVAGHEIGHTLGYSHSCCPAVMKQGYSGSWPTQDDRDGMYYMYGP